MSSNLVISKSNRLTYRDARDMFRLLGEVRQRGDQPLEWRLHMVRGLQGILNAKVSGACELPTPVDFAKRAPIGVVDIGYDSDKIRRHYFEYVYNNPDCAGDPVTPLFAPLLASLKSFTVLRQDLISDEEWYRSEHAQKRMRPCDMDSYVTSVYPVPHMGCCHFISMSRPWGAEPFGVRERKLLHRFHHELGRLWSPRRSSATPGMENASPRLRQTYDRLLAGDGEKQIARRLQLSQHTVHHYVTAVYKHMKVSTRAELITAAQDRRRPDFRPRLCSEMGRAFTLVELLVVIGIIAILMGILIPTVASARRAAVKVECASHLRQLVAGVVLYHDGHRAYPAANYNPMFGAVMPNQIQDRLINDLAPELRYGRVSGSETLDQLPKILVCPVRAEVEVYQTALTDPVPGPVYWFTGYDYYGWIAQTEHNAGVALSPSHCGHGNGTKRSVLWADTIARSTAFGTPTWVYFHLKGNTHFNGIGPGDTTALLGQHRAWSDGSVEWVPVSAIDPDPAHLDSAASYKAGTPGNYFCYWWF
jgi:prepilin-type N-terminal cleavage/methylation domain-containing protein